MNKRGFVTTILTWKQYIVFIIIVIALYYIYMNFFLLKPMNTDTMPIPTQITGTESSYSEQTPNCPSELDQEKVIMGSLVSEGIANIYGGGYDNLDKYGDGSFWGNCRVGQEDGENINYFYCKSVHYTQNDKISDEGVISKGEKYYVNLVYDVNTCVRHQAFPNGMQGTFICDILYLECSDY